MSVELVRYYSIAFRAEVAAMMLAAKDRTFVLLLQYTMHERPRARLNFITAYVDFSRDFHI